MGVMSSVSDGSGLDGFDVNGSVAASMRGCVCPGVTTPSAGLANGSSTCEIFNGDGLDARDRGDFCVSSVSLPASLSWVSRCASKEVLGRSSRSTGTGL